MAVMKMRQTRQSDRMRCDNVHVYRDKHYELTLLFLSVTS